MRTGSHFNHSFRITVLPFSSPPLFAPIIVRFFLKFKHKYLIINYTTLFVRFYKNLTLSVMLFFRYIFLLIQRNYKYVNYQFTFSNIYVLFRLFMHIFYFPYIFAIQNPLYRFFGKGGLSILSYSYSCRIYSYYLLSF